MSHRHVEALIGRLATDPPLRRRFEDAAAAVLHELVAQGYELSSVEIDALASIDRGGNPHVRRHARSKASPSRP
jgi:hypothetical protein